MKVAFDVLPLLSEKMSGIGWCEAGFINALTHKHPENEYFFQFFKGRDETSKLSRLKPFINQNITVDSGSFSGFAYRLIMNFLPLPYKMFFSRKPDITHFFNYIVPPFVHGRKVVTVHDMVIRAYPETVRKRTKLFLLAGLKKSMKRADIIITDSQFSKSEIEKYYPQFIEKVRVVPCGVDFKRFYPIHDNSIVEKTKRNLGIDGDYFLCLGNIEPRKNLKRLIQAYAIFAEKNCSPPKLVISGARGWLCEDIYKQSSTLGIDHLVQFTEYVSNEDICPLINGAEIFLFPSLYEGFGMPPLEAMACGTPVLVSGEGSLPEVVGNSAFIADAYDINSIADGIEKLHNSPSLRKELSEMGIRQAEKFSWENAADILYDIYREILNK